MTRPFQLPVDETTAPTSGQGHRLGWPSGERSLSARGAPGRPAWEGSEIAVLPEPLARLDRQ
jgi:hypothetical protein